MSTNGHPPQPPWYALVVAAVLLVNGVGIIWYETVVETADRPYLIFAALAMMGLVPRSVIDYVRDMLGGGRR